jgi:chromosome segregation ATPase
MDKNKLHGQLEELHAELQQVESVDDSDREMLQRLTKDIRDVLERKDDHAEHYDQLSGRLREAIARLEASHPKATMLMTQVIDQLSYMGI